MIVGITGTRDGLTPAQRLGLEVALKTLTRDEGADTLRHGDCVGVDDEADALAVQLGWTVIIHPPRDDRYRAWCNVKRDRHGTVLPAKDYISRNHDIVDASEIVIACPSTFEEVMRGSGTWATIRYARKTHKRLVVIMPDGRPWQPPRVDWENGGGRDEHGARGNR
jgi:hypothetical protein